MDKRQALARNTSLLRANEANELGITPGAVRWTPPAKSTRQETEEGLVRRLLGYHTSALSCHSAKLRMLLAAAFKALQAQPGMKTWTLPSVALNFKKQ